jgi:hypothetical protein
MQLRRSLLERAARGAGRASTHAHTHLHYTTTIRAHLRARDHKQHHAQTISCGTSLRIAEVTQSDAQPTAEEPSAERAERTQQQPPLCADGTIHPHGAWRLHPFRGLSRRASLSLVFCCASGSVRLNCGVSLGTALGLEGAAKEGGRGGNSGAHKGIPTRTSLSLASPCVPAPSLCVVVTSVLSPRPLTLPSDPRGGRSSQTQTAQHWMALGFESLGRRKEKEADTKNSINA